MIEVRREAIEPELAPLVAEQLGRAEVLCARIDEPDQELLTMLGTSYVYLGQSDRAITTAELVKSPQDKVRMFLAAIETGNEDVMEHLADLPAQFMAANDMHGLVDYLAQTVARGYETVLGADRALSILEYLQPAGSERSSRVLGAAVKLAAALVSVNDVASLQRLRNNVYFSLGTMFVLDAVEPELKLNSRRSRKLIRQIKEHVQNKVQRHNENEAHQRHSLRRYDFDKKDTISDQVRRECSLGITALRALERRGDKRAAKAIDEFTSYGFVDTEVLELAFYGSELRIQGVINERIRKRHHEARYAHYQSSGYLSGDALLRMARFTFDSPKLMEDVATTAYGQYHQSVSSFEGTELFPPLDPKRKHAERVQKRQRFSRYAAMVHAAQAVALQLHPVAQDRREKKRADFQAKNFAMSSSLELAMLDMINYREAVKNGSLPSGDAWADNNKRVELEAEIIKVEEHAKNLNEFDRLRFRKQLLLARVVLENGEAEIDSLTRTNYKMGRGPAHSRAGEQPRILTAIIEDAVRCEMLGVFAEYDREEVISIIDSYDLPGEQVIEATKARLYSNA